MKCVTYNCNSVRNNAEIVKGLLDDCDILFLQELMLLKPDVPFLFSLSEEFNNVACVCDREVEGIVEGRPSKGVAILYKKYLSSYISCVDVDDSLIGIIVSSGIEKILMLNVYMPYDKQNIDALHDYRSSLAKLRSVIEEQNINKVVVVGDYNADPFKGRFWAELVDFRDRLLFFDVSGQLPDDTFTYLCPAKNTTSWLDHILYSRSAADLISKVYVNYECAIYDHFPVHFNLDIMLSSNSFQGDLSIKQLVYWNKISERSKEDIKLFIDKATDKHKLLLKSVFSCREINCKNKVHLRDLEDLYSAMQNILIDSTYEFSVEKEQSFKIVPGWNKYVKNLYRLAHDCFLRWKDHGRPVQGTFLEDMKRTRKQFKDALNFCNRNEDKIRNEIMLEKLHSKNFKELWNEVDKVRKIQIPPASIIDGETDQLNIAELFSSKYKVIFDKCHNGKSNAEDIEIDVSNVKFPDAGRMFSKEDIHKGIAKLRPSIGPDNVHANHLKLSTDLFEHLIALFFSSSILHGYISLDILKGTIGPTIKDRYGNLQCSDNYRPVISSSVFLKLFEYCILEKIEDCLNFSDKQHGFKSNHSTSSACLILKETIHYYLNSNSTVYSCFLDISKAFDSVNHKLLIEKLIDSGVPVMIVNIIKFWYSNQIVKVRYENACSKEWKLCNGVRQGGVLSGIFFNIYIDSLIRNIESTYVGCRLGSLMANVLAYADDITLLAPSCTGLQMLINKAKEEAQKIDLVFNEKKSKCMVFGNRNKSHNVKDFKMGVTSLEFVSYIKYLGFIIQDDLRNNRDIDEARNKFYREFNIILRRMSFADIRIKLYLFKQCCLQFYGAELWYNNNGCLSNLRQFGIAYHKAIKKLLGLSSHESNHYACQEAQLFTFENLLNKIRIFFVYRMLKFPCTFIQKIITFYEQTSEIYKEMSEILCQKYDVDCLLENDRSALLSRIVFVQNREPQMREAFN